MHFSTNAAIVVAGLAAKQAVATGWDVSARGYGTPSNYDNKCSEKQTSGYDWSDLPTGPFSSYGSNKFSGFSCGNSFGKRDALTKRTFQSKCIQGDLEEEPSFSCDEDTEDMSIDEMHVSSSYDTELDCEYTMPDGNKCKHTTSCQAGGSIIKNSQCGGAKSVTFKPRGPKKGGESCSIGIHSIGFNCETGTSTLPSYSSTSAAAYSSSTVVAYTSSSVAAYTTSSAEAYTSDVLQYSTTSSVESSAVSESIPAYSASTASESIPAYSTPAVYSSSTADAVSSSSAPGYSVPSYNTSSAAVYSSSSTADVPVYSTSSAVESSPISESASESAPAYSTPVAYSSSSAVAYSSSSTADVPVYSTTSVGTAPVTYPASSGYTTPAAYNSTTGVPGYASKSSSEASPVSETSSAPAGYETPETPDCLPKCLNTWMYETECKDNSDSDCYCKDEQFMKDVYACISAWSDSDETTSGAASYLMGICAPHVPENPAIVTACPSTVTPVPTPTPYSSTEVSPVETSSAVESIPAYGSSSAPAVPYSSSSVESIPAYGSSSAPAVPSSSSSVVSPVTTSAPVYGSSSVPMTTSTIYTTSVGTITSCAADVADCPAGSTVVVTSTIAISTTICPVTATLTPGYEAPSSSEASPVESSAPGYEAPSSSEASPVESSSAPGYSAPPAYTPAQPSTVTKYSTSEVVVTSCAADVTDCPAESTVVSSTVIPYTTVESEVPAVPTYASESVPAAPYNTGSAPAGYPAGTEVDAVPAESITMPLPYGAQPTTEAPAAPVTESAPIYATTPAATPAPKPAPSTVITYSAPVTVPVTYSTGVSMGFPVPDESTVTDLITTVTVPQVQFTTSTIVVSGTTSYSTGLAAGTPSSAPAYPTADAVGGAAPEGAVGSTGFSTGYAPGPTASNSPIVPYDNGAGAVRVGGSVFAVAAALFFAL